MGHVKAVPPSRARLLPLLVGLATLIAGLVAWVPERGQAEEGDAAAPAVALDPTFFEQRILPIILSNCGECHANPRKRLGKHFLVPYPGRKVRERHVRKNLETIRRYIVPGDPSTSVWLLKALGPRQGGVEHGGGQRIAMNSPEYGAMVDFINGASIAPTPFTPPPRVDGEPDFRFFVAKVAPLLASDCAECHGGKGKGHHKLVVAEEGEDLDLEEHLENFQTILRLIKPGDPERSRLLQKGLAVEDGGLKHKGGDRFRRGDGKHALLEAFVRGEPGPPLPTERTRVARRLDANGLVMEAEDLELVEGVDEVEDAGASGYLAMEPLEGGGRVAVRFDVVDEMAYRIVARWLGTGEGARLRVDAVVDTPLEPVDPATRASGWRDFVARHVTDAGQPLADARGRLALGPEGVELDGRDTPAGFLVPDPVRRNGCEIELTLPVEEDGGDDALLLFDAVSLDEARFVGLVDGGRRFVLGHVSEGTTVVERAVVAPEEDGPELPRVIRVERHGGVAVASLDGRPLLAQDLADDKARGSYGVRTRGRLDVHRLSAVEEFEVAGAAFELAPVVWLAPGPHVVVIEMPEGAGRLDQIRIERP